MSTNSEAGGGGLLLPHHHPRLLMFREEGRNLPAGHGLYFQEGGRVEEEEEGGEDGVRRGDLLSGGGDGLADQTMDPADDSGRQ